MEKSGFAPMSKGKGQPRYLRMLAEQLAHRGLEIRRHSATRRQAMLAKHQVDLIFDVGGADGGYGRSLRTFGYAGRIESFEPLSAAFTRLSEATAADPQWSVHNIAIGSVPGETTINIASNSASSSLLPMLDAHREAAPWVQYVATETVVVERLDDVAGDALQSAQYPFLKIDTQGFERAVLEGGADTVAQCVGLQIELSFVPLYEGAMLVDEAIVWAYKQGFQLVGIEQGYAAPSGELLQVDGVFFRGGDG